MNSHTLFWMSVKTLFSNRCCQGITHICDLYVNQLQIWLNIEASMHASAQSASSPVILMQHLVIQGEKVVDDSNI